MALKTYAELDINITDVNSTTFVPALNGRQGDNNREVFLWLKNGKQGYDLTGKTVTLYVKDAAGVVKTASTMNDQTGISTGHFSLLVPSAVYQAPGSVQDSYIQIKQNDTVITSIPVAFNVLENTMLVTQTQSETYLDSVQKLVDDANTRLSATTSNLTAVENAVQALQVTISNLNEQYNSDLFAKKGNDNEFKGNNTFDNKIIAPNGLQGKADTAGLADNATTADLARKVDGTQRQSFDSGAYFGQTINISGEVRSTKALISDGGLLVNQGGGNITDYLNIYGLFTAYDGRFSGSLTSKKTVNGYQFDNGFNCQFVRVGNHVTLHVFGNITSDHNAFTTIGWKIPSGYRPVTETFGLASAGFSKTMLHFWPTGDVGIVDTAMKSSDNNGGDNVAYGFANWDTTDDFPE